VGSGSSPSPTTTFTSFPTPECCECAAAPASQPVCLQLMWKWVFPPLLCSFLPLLLLQTFLLLVARRVPPLLPSPAQLVYLQFWEGPLPPSSAFRAPHPHCYVSSLFLLLITQFLFFSLGGGWSVQGAMLIWPRVVCGSTTYCLAHLVVCVFPSWLGTDVWQWPGGPPGFSI
jgi:hypothetical protein